MGWGAIHRYGTRAIVVTLCGGAIVGGLLFGSLHHEAAIVALLAFMGAMHRRPEAGVAVEPAPPDHRMRRIVADAAAALGLSSKLMPSGAGHDAQDMSHVALVGMIFVPSVGGSAIRPGSTRSPEISRTAQTC